MTPKEKAKELYFKMHSQEQIISKEAKQCALIAIDEILDVIVTIYDYDFEKLNPYWEEVKKEIENI
jgi:hypothetical protein